MINSDIKIDSRHEDFQADWESERGQFNVGIRYDFDEPGQPKIMNSYGIDAFLITEEAMERIPDEGFVIGYLSGTIGLYGT